MITEVVIENFKSINKLTFPLGRVNVLIGENGSGKSNILEAIAFGAGATKFTLDNESLYSRGIRVSENPKFMRAAFDHSNVSKAISLSFQIRSGESIKFEITNDNMPYSSWNVKPSGDLGSNSEFVKTFLGSLGNKKEENKDLIRVLNIALSNNIVLTYLSEFLIYSPENTMLRSSHQEGQILPLGIRGEGLFRYLRYLSAPKNKSLFDDIKCRMRCLEWFQDFELSKESTRDDVRFDIQDKFIPENVGAFDQLSTNEGFLIILFYFCLLVGEETPRFFAIDNIDTSLNPKLCSRLMKEMVDLARKYDKQLILTTHNPAILDGLNLDDDEQRLYIVSRNRIGETTLRRFMKRKQEEGVEPVRLSEAFLRGYIGGLPGNF